MKYLMPENRSFEVGKKFGLLTILGHGEYRQYKCNNRMKGEFKWKMICDCGIVKEFLPANIRKGTTISCGHVLKSMKGKYGQSRQYQFYDSYRRNAISKKLEFKLTVDEFNNIVFKECFYCGAPPKLYSKSKKAYNGSLPTNGVDRIDNNLGYFLKNVVTCCSTCNWMKNKFEKQFFLNHVKNIYEFNQIKDDNSGVLSSLAWG